MKSVWLKNGFVLICTLAWLVPLACHQRVFRPFEKIVFLSNRDAEQGQFDIFIMNPDGSGQQNLSASLNTIRTHSRPRLSPDQKYIAFTSFEEQGPALQLMTLQDRSIARLAWLTLNSPDAEFSPDGKKIVFVQKANDRRQINMVNSDGTNEINWSENAYDEYDPSFSSDGRTIVYVSKRPEGFVICTLDIENGNVSEIYNDPGIPHDPVFSPDDSEIAFASQRQGISDIYIFKSDGTDVKNLTDSRSYEKSPLFDSDGNKIVFISNQRGMKYQDICVIDKDGKNFHNLTSDLNYINQNPNITPDGKFIIFDSVKFNDSEIYKVEIESGVRTNLTQHPKWDQAPDI